MILKCSLIFLGFSILIPGSYEMNASELEAFMSWIEVFYEDACHTAAEAEWKFINDPTNQTLLLAWERAQVDYNSFKKEQAAAIKNLPDVKLKNSLLEYKLSVAKKPGDALLNATEWNQLVSFLGEATILRTGVNNTDGSRHNIERLLSKSGNLEEKRLAWSKWHSQLSPLLETYSSLLSLVVEAAEENGVDTVTSYWELLSGYNEGYEKIELMWEEITDLHTKLTTFVRNRISQKYKVKLEDDGIPAYLLGSLDGYDWTSLVPTIIPYGNVTYNIKKNLWEKNLRGINLYKSASLTGKSVLNAVPVANFWRTSRFNQSCPTQLINFCVPASARVSTCHQASIGNFLSTHKTVAKVLLDQMKEDNSSFFNMANRYSGLDEGVSELFSILSVTPEQLHTLGLVDNNTDTEHSQITSLMITALDVLPRLAYYMSADFWRINVIKNGTLAPNELLKTWWLHRKQYEKVTTNSSDIPTFLDDEFITSNKPYLPKFIGTVLAFQLYEHLTGWTEVRYDGAVKYQINDDLITMIQKGGADAWTKVLNQFLNIDEITTDAMLSFFQPLKDYLEKNPDDIYPLNESQETELDRLDDLYESIDVTTPPAKTTTIRTPVLLSKTSTTTTTTKQPPSKNESIPTKSKPGMFPEIEEVTEESSTESDYSSGINTSKAVWAVAAVLVATVIICVIAIFGRRRCVKSQAPKNRRYL